MRLTGLLLLTLAAAATAGEFYGVGTPASFLQRLRDANTAVSREFEFPTGMTEPIKVNVEDYVYQDGYLSMVGRALQSKNSDFIFKGTEADLYGWVVLKDRDLAFEYTTDKMGMVVVEQVPVEKIFPICDLPEPHPDIVNHPEPQLGGPEPHIGPYPAGLAVNKFQSKPGAPKVLYWNIADAMNLWTPAQMWEAWQTFSATMSMFDVNVTTDPAVWNATPAANRGQSHQVAGDGRSSCGLNSFGTSRACNIYKKSSPAYQGGTLGHETGHQIGLSHDGSSSGAYFSGFRSWQWVPMMGSHASGISNSQGALQYSKGEYQGANNTQDDFQVITVTRQHLSFRAKTHTGVKPLVVTGTTVSALSNRGQIVKNTDVDVWSFRLASSGRVRLEIVRTERTYGSMLDIDATLLDGSGSRIANSNRQVNRTAGFDQTLPAGNYSLAIKGGAEGTPLNGFSNYSSLGFYAIEGEIANAVPTRPSHPSLEKAVRVHPVSANGLLKLDFPADARVERITLFYATGAVAFSSRRPMRTIDMSGLASGRYLLDIAMNGGTVARSVVKP